MIVLLVLVALLAAVTWTLVKVSRETSLVWRESHDGALCLVVLATNWMSAEPLGWATAMRAEFVCVSGRTARWHFALGCLRTALLSGRRGSRGLMLTVAVLSGLCLGLMTYGRVRYPTAVAAGGGYTVLLVLFLTGGVLLASRGNSATRPDTELVRHYGIAGGLTVGLLLVVAVSPPAYVGYAGLLGMALVVALAARATWISGNPRSGIRVGIWMGLISGMVFFIGLMTLTYAAAGWFTYNAEAVSVFNNFGPVTQHGHQLQQWPGFNRFLVRRESSVAVLFGFLVEPFLAVALGAIGGLVGRRRQGKSLTVAT